MKVSCGAVLLQISEFMKESGEDELIKKYHHEHKNIDQSDETIILSSIFAIFRLLG